MPSPHHRLAHRTLVFPWRWLAWLAYLVLVFGPVLALAYEAVFVPGSAGDGGWALVIPSGRRLGLMLNSLGLAAAVALVGMLLGGLVALFLIQWNRGAWVYLRWLALVLAPLPLYVHALAWSTSLPLQGWLGSVWVQVMGLAPVAVGITLVGLASVEPLLVDAARLARSDMAGLRRVVLPLAGPTLMA
ncbi:MAG: hypothetical protein EHM70_10545 [Chloroflexota bacterium]|nr:MAG: hypothetical protein EHM70_10545 [Chloroflexota bacterium]